MRAGSGRYYRRHQHAWTILEEPHRGGRLPRGMQDGAFFYQETGRRALPVKELEPRISIRPRSTRRSLLCSLRAVDRESGSGVRRFMGKVVCFRVRRNLTGTVNACGGRV